MSIETSMGEFKAVIFEKSEFEHRNIHLLTAFNATFGQSGFQVQCRKKITIFTLNILPQEKAYWLRP